MLAPLLSGTSERSTFFKQQNVYLITDTAISCIISLTMESSSNELTVAHEVSIRSRTQGAKSSIIPANESVHELELVPVVQENIEEPVLEMIIDPVIPSPRLSRSGLSKLVFLTIGFFLPRVIIND